MAGQKDKLPLTGLFVDKNTPSFWRKQRKMICFILLFIGGSVNISLPTFLLRNCNPRSPWGERRDSPIIIHYPKTISIHTPRGGSDWQRLMFSRDLARFQSTLLVRGATPKFIFCFDHCRISIHAPREGSDCKNAQKRICIFGKEYNFYSRQLF